MTLCVRCILPETFPGISFDEGGVCNFCNNFKGHESLKNQKEKYKGKFEELLAIHRNKSDYDAIVAFSGGKDSSYTIHILKEKYNLNILTITFDNGFISERALANIRNVVESLNVDHLIYKPRFDVLRKIFLAGAKDALFSRKTLDRASTICTSCIGIVKFIVLRTAIEKEIPFIAFGWSPGQAPINSSVLRNNVSMIRTMQDAIRRPLEEIVGDKIAPYFLEDSHFKRADLFPTNVSPLAFWDYDENNILKTIKKFGWVSPSDTDSNSTNCTLNSFANKVHKEKYNYHPYVFEIAKMVREGVMSRKEGIEKINRSEDNSIVEAVRKRLGC